MTEQKRARGRPKKAEENPDCEVATKGYVKCVARKYHEEQTLRNMKHQQGSTGLLLAAMWAVVAIAVGCAYVFTGSHDAATISVVAGMLCINVIMHITSWDDTIRCASEHTGFIQPHTEPPCERKKECE